MASDKTVTFGIKVPVETDAGEGANAVEALRKQIESSTDAIKKYGSSLKGLRGASEEVKTAREKLKAAMNAEREAISRSTLALGKHGVTLLDAQRKTQEAAKGTSLLSKGLSAAATGATALVAALVAVGVAEVAATVGLAGFVLQAANARRTQNLFFEAAAGAENVKALGHQLDDLATKVPQSRDELNKLGLDMTRAFAGTRVSGQGLVDTMNAVAQTSAAMGDQAGSAIQGLIERGKQFGRFSLNINELQGTGVKFQDVAGQLAKDLKIGLRDAQNQLVMGRVNINDGAAALRKVVETKFGGINVRRMLDVNVMAQKFKDSLSKLTEGVNIESLLEGFGKLAGLFDTSTVTGSVLKGLITDFGNTVGSVFKEAMPYVTTFFNQFLIESLKMEIAVLKLAAYVKETFGIDIRHALDDTSSAVTLAKVAFWTFAAVAGVVAAAVLLIAGAMWASYKATQALIEAVKSVVKYFDDVDWAASGRAIIDGLVNGITGGDPLLGKAVRALGTTVKDAFKDVLGIHSPSTVFEGYGENIDQGAAKGMKKKGHAEQAATSMIPTSIPLGGSGIGGGAGGGAPITIHLHIAFPNAKNGAEVAAELTGPTFKAQLHKALQEIMRGAAIPIQSPRGA